jgi:hypothetical protein
MDIKNDTGLIVKICKQMPKGTACQSIYNEYFGGGGIIDALLSLNHIFFFSPAT